MQVSAFMTIEPIYIEPNASLIDAAIVMREIDCGILPIGDGEKLVGILTDRDIIVRALAHGKAPESTVVKEVMTPDILYCYDNDAVTQAAEHMKNMQVKRLVVLNRNEDFIGLVSLEDLENGVKNEYYINEDIAKISA